MPIVLEFFFAGWVWPSQPPSGKSSSGQFSPKVPNFSIIFLLNQKKSLWVGSKKYPGQSFIYCGSKVFLSGVQIRESGESFCLFASTSTTFNHLRCISS